MSGENLQPDGTSRSSAIREPRDEARVLAAAIRNSPEIFSFDIVIRRSGAKELFTAAQRKASFIDSALSQISRTIASKGPKRKDFDDAKTIIIQKIAEDPVYNLTPQFLTNTHQAIPPILVEAEAISGQKDLTGEVAAVSKKRPVFRLEGRKYAEPDRSILHILSFVNAEQAISIETLDALIYPKVYIDHKWVKIRDSIAKVNALLKRFNPDYQVAMLNAGSEDDSQTLCYLTRAVAVTEHPIVEFTSTGSVAATDQERKARLYMNKEETHVWVGDDRISLEERSQAYKKVIKDGLLLFGYLQDHAERLVTMSELVDFYQQKNPSLTLHVQTIRHHIQKAMSWIMNNVRVDDNALVKSRHEGKNVLYFGLTDTYATVEVVTHPE